MARIVSFGTGRDGASWPVLLLLATVLVPSGGVVWMMRQAMQNERLAGRQRLADAYQVQLDSAQQQIAERWSAELNRLDELAVGKTPAEAFAACVASGMVDSAVVLDAAGESLYPNQQAEGDAGERAFQLTWRRAERLEFVDRDFGEAAKAYEEIAAAADDPELIAQARQAQARCLERSGDLAGAVRLLEQLRKEANVRDGGMPSRSRAADVELRLIELYGPNSQEAAPVIASLRGRLNNYSPPAWSPDQRRFLMQRLKELASTAGTMPTLAAEELAAEYLANPGEAAAPNRLHLTGAPDVWSMRSPGDKVVALYRTETLKQRCRDLVADQPLSQGVRLDVLAPGEVSGTGEELATVPIDDSMPQWRLALTSDGDQLYDQAADARVATMLWIAAAVGAVTLVLGWLAATSLQGRLRVARMKNDLVATVSHELKTPLASIRLLVDTLLEQGDHPPTSEGTARSRDYLQLISQENARLTRLIDNFLTFSRLERGKQRYTFDVVPLAEVVRQAVAAVGDRFDGVDAQLAIAVDESICVRGDVDGLVTVVVNLLDNAWKYTGAQKRVSLTVRRDGDRATISVADNGVGLAPRAARKVFDRFYQVDQRVARTQGGCGLGLSIVRSIVEAHGGQVSVTSRPDEGSTFVVSLPAVGVVTSHAEVSRGVRPADLRPDASEDFGVTEARVPKASKT